MCPCLPPPISVATGRAQFTIERKKFLNSSVVYSTLAMGTTTPLRMASSAARRVAMLVAELMTVAMAAASMAASVAALAINSVELN